MLVSVARSARFHARVAFTRRRLLPPLVLAALAAAGGLAARIGGLRPLHAFDLGVEWGWLLVFPGVAGLGLAAGAWGLEVESRTLTYLMIRPVKRAHLYLGKVLAVAALLAAIGAVGTGALYLATWGSGGGAELAAGLPYLWRAEVGAVLAGIGYACLLGLFGVAIGPKGFLAAATYVLAIEWLISRSGMALHWIALSHNLRVVAGVGARGTGGHALVSAGVVLGISVATLVAGMILAGRLEHRIAGGTS